MAHPRLSAPSRAALFSACAAVVACASAPPPPAPPPAPPAAARDAFGFVDKGWQRVASTRFFVEVPLPDAATWRVDDRTDRWFVATHLPSKSMLWIRAWRAGSVVSHRECETEARGYRPDLFGRTEDALVDRRPLGAPEGFDTEVGFAIHKKGSALGGVVAAAGANVRRCLVMAYATRAEGPDAERVLAERMAFVAARVMGRVEGRTVEDRARGSTDTEAVPERPSAPPVSAPVLP